MPFVIVDDGRLTDNINLVGRQWSRHRGTEAPGAHNATVSTCQPELAGKDAPPELKFSFIGPEISLVGTPTADLRMNYSIDGSSPRDANLNFLKEDVGKTGVVIWTFKNIVATLSPNKIHNVSLYPYAGELNVDYLLYKTVDTDVDPPLTIVVNNETDNNDFILDPDDAWIIQSWVERTTPPPPALLLNSSWLIARNPGSSFEYTFAGDTISVYGAMNSAPGILKAQYAVDGVESETITYFDGTQTIDPNNWNFTRLFTQTMHPMGFNHTLKVNVTELTEDQTFRFNYLTYEANAPAHFTHPPPQFSDYLQTSLGPRDFPVGGTVGIVLGGMLVVFAMWWAWKIWRRRSERARPQAYGLQVLRPPHTRQTGRLQSDVELNLPPEVPYYEDDDNEPPPPWSPPQGSLESHDGTIPPLPATWHTPVPNTLPSLLPSSSPPSLHRAPSSSSSPLPPHSQLHIESEVPASPTNTERVGAAVNPGSGSYLDSSETLWRRTSTSASSRISRLSSRLDVDDGQGQLGEDVRNASPPPIPTEDPPCYEERGA
ncbi:hypothetical protein DFP72DRAFT_929963 [Ephemerocybe angulata]|uniref:Uncharacterized protein n=1 Tax=Ephemerocybe angulata TaxID=980116 RepID=A0A8H6HBY4_9AGAR|nr:hypothetical protein DFP72DRAFT_929963 [Tulosesus angulatus]